MSAALRLHQSILAAALASLGVFMALFLLSTAPAHAATTHEFLAPLTDQLEKGAPVGCGVEPPETEPPCISGPLSIVKAMTVDSGHLWLAEQVEKAGKQLGSRVDEFDDSTGVFMHQLNEEGGVTGLESGVAVGHPGGEENVYVGAAEPKGSAVAVFGPSGNLQPEGVWSGEHTLAKSFAQLEGIAVDASANLETHGDVYVATRGPNGTRQECEESLASEEAKCAVDVFPGEAGGKEPTKLIGQLTGTCEKAGEIPPACPESRFLSFAKPSGVAVSPVNGDVLVADDPSPECAAGEAECVVDVFEPVSGMPGVYRFLFKITGPDEPFFLIGPLAINGEGDIYVAEFESLGGGVDQFNAAGEFVTQLKGTAPGTPFHRLKSVAADPQSGNLYVGEFDEGQGTGAVDAFGPSLIVPDVTTTAATGIGVTAQGKIQATLNGTVNPLNQGAATCQFVFGTSGTFDQSMPCQPEAVPNGNVAVPVKATINDELTPGTELAADTTYFLRLQASNSKGTNEGEESQNQELHTPGPGLHGESAFEVASTSATLGATIDPNGASTSYYFQYGKSVSYEEPPIPAPPGASVGSGSGDVARHVQGLAPETVYHYRVVAVSVLEVEGVPQAVSFFGPDRTFTTQGGGGGLPLPDGRRWELVSPPNKHGALIEPIAEGGVQSSAAGGALTFVTNLPTEEAVKGSVVLGAQAAAERGPHGWVSHDISPAHAAALGLPVGLGHEYRAFSSDLSAALVEPFGEFTSLTPEVFPPDTERTQYIRDEATCAATPATCFEPLVTGAPGYADVPEGTKFGGDASTSLFVGEENFVGTSADLAHVILRSAVSLTGAPIGNNDKELYEWSGGRPSNERLQLVSLLPANEQGEELPFEGEADLGSAKIRGRHAVSEDGSHVVWSGGAHVYVRDTSVGKTVQLDLPGAECLSKEECGVGIANAQFQLAAADGSRVLFTDTQQLTKDAGRTPNAADLYECTVVTEAGQPRCELSDLTPSAGPRNAADVRGSVVGASEDGTWAYFVANGVLGDAGEHGATQGNCSLARLEGEDHCNLYLYQNGSTHFIATLGVEDNPDWSGNGGDLEHITARVSPDGQWLAFMSNRSLTGYDNRDAVSTKPDEEVFLYHAAKGTPESLVCASCDPSGARPVGMEARSLAGGLVGADPWNPNTWLAANIPGWTPYAIAQAVYQSRYLSNSGRLFVNSGDALVAQDINNNQDVYEYQPVGTGDCASGSSTFHEVSGGCVALISSGRARGESGFLDASESGDDVFFLTAEHLVPEDVDSAIDVYDAHVCSAGAPCVEEAEKPPPCATADACRTAPSPRPDIFGSPPSSTFSGPGNIVPPRAPTLTAKQKLTRALKACRAAHAKSKKRRVACERQARRRYGVKSPRKADASKGRNR
jgi:WD40-like Beta Propeller Repeat